MKRKVTFRDVPNFSPAEEIIYLELVLMYEGWREGRREGMRTVVSNLLTQRFGPLSAHVTERLQAATKAELEAMGLRILDAKTLDEVLGKPKRRTPTSTVRPSETPARDATPNTRDARP